MPDNGNFLSRLLHGRGPESVEELEGVIDDARRREIISRNTEDMIKGVFDVGRQRVSEVMIPRSEMITMQPEATVQQAAAIVAETGHSRYPVLSGVKDHIDGILLAKDLLPPLAGLSKEQGISGLLRRPVIVPESKRVSAMLREFQNERFHMAIAVDEFGTVSGLITIEDILELIVGDIEDEYDEAEESPLIARSREKNTWIVSGLTPVEDFENYFKVTLPKADVDTVAGVVLHVLGCFPKEGQKLALGQLKVEVLQAGERRVRLLKVIVPQKADRP
ncbi:MAG: transporter associated domain-containing protein [Succinivibrio sp.]|jgi:magnesium and cobalt transporter|nr:transporter associated domain-containing protein [Succinivibrio sp.]